MISTLPTSGSKYLHWVLTWMKLMSTVLRSVLNESQSPKSPWHPNVDNCAGIDDTPEGELSCNLWLLVPVPVGISSSSR